MFIYTIRELRDEAGSVIQEAIPVCGDPPDGFHRFQAGVEAKVGQDNQGRAIVARGLFPIDAETVEEAFEEAAATMKAKAMQEVTRPRIALPNGTFKLRE